MKAVLQVGTFDNKNINVVVNPVILKGFVAQQTFTNACSWQRRLEKSPIDFTVQDNVRSSVHI
jgi:hypothetical protein